MLNPRYLALSRHNVFYFRFPIPKALHPQAKVTHIKISLETRHPGEALQLARILFYVGGEIIKGSNIVSVTLEEIRQVLTSHFQQVLRRRKEHIAINGPHKDRELQALQSTYEASADAIRHNDFLLAMPDDDEVDKQAAHFGFKFTQGDKEWLMFRSELVKARRDFSKIILEHNEAGGIYDFSAPAAMPPCL